MYCKLLLRPNKIDDEDSVAWPITKCGMRVFILSKKKKGKCGIFQIYFIIMKMYVSIIINRFLIIKIIKCIYRSQFLLRCQYPGFQNGAK